jgi:ABC-2 type transport system permease protein
VLLPLLLKTWRDHWRGLIAWAVGRVLITAVQLWVYPSIRDSAASASQLVEAFPEEMRQIFDMSTYTTGEGYLNVELFSMVVPLIFIAVGATWGAGATADEEEKGTADLLLTLPVSWGRIVATKIVATVLALALLAAVLTVAVTVGSRLIDMEIEPANVASACLMAGLLGILYAGVGFLVGAMTGRRGVAIGATITLALAAFIAYSLASMVDFFENINPANPFEWALGLNPLANGIDVGYALRLLLLSIVLLVGSVLVFRRRDIRSA